MAQRSSARLIVQILFVVFAVSLCTGLLSYVVNSRAITQNTLETQLEILDQTRTLVETVLAQIEKTAYTLAINRDVHELLTQRWVIEEDFLTLVRTNDLFIYRVSSSDFIHSISLYSVGNGKVLSDSGAIDIDLHKDRVLLKGFLDTDRSVAWLNTRVILPDIVEFRNVISIALRVPIDARSPKGVLMINVVEDFLYDTVISLNRPRLGRVFVLDKSGIILSNVRKDLLYQRFDLRSDVATESRGYYIDSGSQARQLVSFVRSDFNDWTYVAVSPYSTVTAGPRLVLIVTLSLSALSALVGAAVSVLISRRHYRPIRRLVDHLHAFTGHEGGELLSDEFAYIDASMHRILRQNAEFESRYAETRKALREHFLFDLMVGREADRGRIAERLSYFDLELRPGSFAVMILRIVDLHDYGDDDGLESKNVVTYGLALQAEAIVQRRAHGFVVHRAWDELAILVNFPEYVEAQAAVDISRRIAEEVRSSLGRTVAGGVYVGIGDVYHDVLDLRLSYDEALDALNYQGVAGKGNIIHIEDITHGKDSRRSARVFEARKERIVGELKSGDTKSAGKQIAEYLSGLLADEQTAYAQRKAFVLDLANAAVNIALANDVDLGETEPLFELEHLRSPDEVTVWFETLLTRIADAMGEIPSSRARCVVESVKRYMDERYAEQIDLNCIADMTRLNARYFCRLFKEETGMTYLEYLTARRLDAAKAMLGGTDKSVSDIAAETGFLNKRNIARAFKRRLGTTPTEYRRSRVVRRIAGTSETT